MVDGVTVIKCASVSSQAFEDTALEAAEVSYFKVICGGNCDLNTFCVSIFGVSCPDSVSVGDALLEGTSPLINGLNIVTCRVGNGSPGRVVVPWSEPLAGHF